MVCPTTPPPMARSENADRKIMPNTAGILGAFTMITIRAINRYARDINGTTKEATSARRFIPPKITRAVRIISTTPISQVGASSQIPVTAETTELHCSITYTTPIPSNTKTA